MRRWRIGLSVLAGAAMLSAIAATALAADYYVDPVVGSDELGDGSQAAPWLTIQHAFDSIEGTAAEPHTVHLAAGVYGRDTNGETGVDVEGFWNVVGGEFESIGGSGAGCCSVELRIYPADGVDVSAMSCSVFCGSNSPVIRVCAFSSLQTGITCMADSQTVVDRCAFYNCSNALLQTPPSARPTIRNSVFFGNRSNIMTAEGQTANVTYSLVEGGYPGEGNIDADPRWIDPVNGDFRLRWDSPCIDAGDPNDPVPPGGGSRIDMGAFEYQFLPIPAVTGLAFDDSEGGDGDGIPEAGEVVRCWVTVTNYGEPAHGLAATLVFEDPSIVVLDGQADFPYLASGESGQTLGDGFAWRVPSDWPPAGPVEMVLNWTSAEGSDSERWWVSLNGTDVWAAVTGDDETGLGTRAAPWRTLRHALVSVHGTHLQPATVHLEEGTYSIATNGEVFPIRPGPYETVRGGWNTARPIVDSAGSGESLWYGSHGSRIVDLDLRFAGGEVGEGGCNFRRATGDVVGCSLTRSGSLGKGLFTERSLFVTRCVCNAPIGGADSTIVDNRLTSVSLTHGLLQFNQIQGGLVQVPGISAAQILDNMFLPDGRAASALYVFGQSVARNNIVLEDTIQSAATVEHNYMDGLSFDISHDAAHLHCSGGSVKNNIFVSRGIPVELVGPFQPIDFRNNVVVGGLQGIDVSMTNPTLENVTVYSASEETEYGIDQGNPRNSIIWTPGIDVWQGEASYCCIEDGVLPGEGNISAEPLLIGAGHSTALTPFSLVDESAHWEPGVLKGMRLNPNLAQYETLLVDTNTADEIFVFGDPRELASAGDAYLVPWMKLQSTAEGWPADSPCIDAGDPDPAYNDPDGSRNDMGAWGGPYAEGHYSPTPSPTPTLSPTVTVTPATTPTPSATPPPTSTATPEPQLGVSLWMPAHEFAPGDLCALIATVRNPGPPLAMVPLFVVLAVYGEYWFAPSWAHWPDEGLDGYFYETLPVGSQEIRVIEPFTWPEGAGSAEGLFFHAALTDPELTTVLGELASWEFEFGP